MLAKRLLLAEGRDAVIKGSVPVFRLLTVQKGNPSDVIKTRRSLALKV